MTPRPKLICLTPIKNEAWILETFLKCASVWADHIIVADQMSTDASRQIASKFEKVILVDNDSPTFNEPERVQLLLREARKIPGPKILIALDADEILAGDLDLLRGEEFLSRAPGTRLAFDWLNVHPSLQTFWNPNPPMCWGFVDDGSPYAGAKIHSGRVPEPAGSPLVAISGVQVLHLQYVDWARMQSKQRWYQCYERITYPERNAVSIYRRYHHMDAVPSRDLVPLRAGDLAVYRDRGIDPFDHRKEQVYRWDPDIARMLQQHGPEVFRTIDIWNDVDWSALDLDGKPAGIADPRNPLHRALSWYLKRTQPFSNGGFLKLFDKLVKVVLKVALPERDPADQVA